MGFALAPRLGADAFVPLAGFFSMISESCSVRFLVQYGAGHPRVPCLSDTYRLRLNLAINVHSLQLGGPIGQRRSDFVVCNGERCHSSPVLGLEGHWPFLHAVSLTLVRAVLMRQPR